MRIRVRLALLLLLVAALLRADVVVYGDAIGSGWQDWSWGGVTRDFARSAPVHGGSASIGVTFTAGWSGVQLGRNDAVSISGLDTLRYGPMKPVGLRGPDGRRPWAVVQLRAETLEKRHFNLVGFQSRMKWGDQQRVFRTLPGFAEAEFVRLGQIHRNTFVNAPAGLDARFRVKNLPRLRLAGQITGVEGYLESAATGLAVAIDLVRERRGLDLEPPPGGTALGALVRHLTESDPKHFQPANVHYGLFPPLVPEPPRKERRAAYAERARRELAAWRARVGLAS